MTGETILIVEDEALEGLELQESLERLGYRVPTVVSSGDEVVEQVMKTKPRLIIMDIHLKSFLDGIDAAHRVRMIYDVPIIYLTAYANEKIKERAMTTKPEGYLLKPISDEELKEQVKKALARSEN